MARREEGESGGVDDAEGLHAEDVAGGVDDGGRVALAAHLVGGTRVMDGLHSALDELEDLGIALCARARRHLLADRDVRSGRELAGATEGLDGDGLVGGGAEPVGVDERVGGRVGGPKRHVAARRRPNQGDGHAHIVYLRVRGGALLRE